MSHVEEHQVLLVLGCPGSGKRTQCMNIAKEYGFFYISADDLVREELQRVGSQYGSLIKNHMVNAMIVPAEIVCKLIEITMKKSGTNKFVIDGFPRNLLYLEGWKKLLGSKVNLLFVLYLQCVANVCARRSLQKGLKSSSYSDEEVVTIKKKIKKFYAETLPVVKYYKVLGLVKTVDGAKPKKDVFNTIKNIFDRL